MQSGGQQFWPGVADFVPDDQSQPCHVAEGRQSLRSRDRRCDPRGPADLSGRGTSTNCLLGELGFDGRVRPVRGVLPATLATRPPYRDPIIQHRWPASSAAASGSPGQVLSHAPTKEFYFSTTPTEAQSHPIGTRVIPAREDVRLPVHTSDRRGFRGCDGRSGAPSPLAVRRDRGGYPSVLTGHGRPPHAPSGWSVGNQRQRVVRDLEPKPPVELEILPSCRGQVAR